MRKFIAISFFVFLFISPSFAQVSFNMNLLDQWDESGLSYNDCWGYVDGNNNEYAILGSYSKIHFFQITANGDFVLVDEFTPGATTVWRDFKTYGNNAYAVSEGNEGLLVYNLSNLPTSVSLSHTITSEFDRAHNIYIDEANGKLYVAGSNTQSNGLIIYDVTTNPPTHLASVSLPGGGYVHDLYVKNNTAYCSHGNNGFYIWDVSTPTSPSFLASFTGEQGYNHSSWVTPDGNTAFYAREIGVGLPMTALDISDYNDLEVISNFKYPLLAPTHLDNVPHNPYLVGNYLYTSYYEDGVQVFDVSDPANVTQAAYYDTYPSNTQYNGYEGCWGVYPFLPSGRILASDDINGLFLLELDISNNPPLVLNVINQTNVLCNGENTGSIEVEAMGGVPPYTYTLDNGTPQTSGLFENLFAGTYNLKITDAVGVINNTPIIISEPSAILPSILLLQNVTCFGNADGSMTAQATGGTVSSSHQYSIDGVNFFSNNTFTNLSGGAYTLSVRDDNNCIVTLDFNIIEPDELISFSTDLTNVDCFGNNNGEATFFTFGGVPPYLFSLDQVDYQPVANFINLSGGNYTLYTLDANNCQTTTPFSITEPLLLEISITQQTDLNCFGENIGEVILNGQGGTTDYQYNVNGESYQSSSTFSNLAAGNFDFNIKDANDCIASISTVITSQPELVINISEIIHVDCFGENTGSISINISGGEGSYTSTLNGYTQTGNTIVFENLTANNYSLFVEDGNGCTNNQSIEITESPEFEIFPFNIQNPSCFNSNDGVFQIMPINGIGNIEYSINSLPTGSNPIFENLGGGIYTISAIDNLGCEALTQVELTTPSPIIVNLIDLNNVSCGATNDGSVNISGTGGVGVLEYILNGTTNTTGVFNNLSEGNYTVVVSDENDCIEVLNFTITAPAAISAQVTNSTNIDCNGNMNGSFQVTASGGSSNYIFDIGSSSNTNGFFENLGAGFYNISITDDNNCQTIISTELTEPNIITANISNTQEVSCFGQNNGSVEIQASGGTGNLTFTLGNESNTNGIFQNLQAGIYNIGISDQNNCQNSIEIQITQPNEIIANISNTQDVSCFGQNDGSVQIQANGGTGNLIYTLGNESNANGLFQNLQAGIYNIAISDQNNCQNSIEVQITQPNEITANILNTQDVSCFGQNDGSVQIQANGGTGNLIYTLGNDSNSNGVFQNLQAGVYNIEISDQNNCQNAIEVQITQPNDIIVNISSTQNVSCFGQNDGSVQIQANGGTGNLTFTLGNDSNSNGVFQNLQDGTYNITITDQNNCQNNINVEITEPPLLTISTTTIQLASCNGQQGAIQVEAQGGTLPYQFSNGSETNSNGLFENLAAGIYLINVTDANNCTSNIEVNITEPEALNIEIIQTQNPRCNGENSGSIQLNTIGDSGIVNYTLGNETNNSGIFENLLAGVYNITITDDNNCLSLVEIILNDPPPLEIEIVQINKNNCFGDSNGSITLNAFGGTGGLTFSMGNETNTSGVFENLAAGSYSVSFFDENNCQNTIPFTITEPLILTANISQINAVGCTGEQTGSVQFNAEGGTGAYTFSLEGETNSTGLFENLGAGNFTMDLTDENGCTFSQNITITEPLPLVLDFSITQTPICNGDFLGIALTATGGVGNYQFTINNETNGSGDFQNLFAGTYLAIVTDGNGCTNGLEITINEPPAITLTTNQIQAVNCHGENSGSVSFTASGGTGSLQFTLNNETNSTGEFANLSVGIYDVIVTDENNCSSNLIFEITEPQPLNVDLVEVLNINCDGDQNGSIQVDATGGSGNFQFTLGNETNSLGLFENLSAGEYEISVMDNNNCTSTILAIIIENAPINSSIISLNEVSCNGGNDGSITLMTSGGTPPFTFHLNNQINNTGVFENLSTGEYNIIITDNKNCIQSTTFTIAEPLAISFSVQETQSINCSGDQSASLIVSGSGGTGSLQYTLNNETNATGIFENLGAGNYDIIATDENNCTLILPILIEEPTPFTTNILQNQNLFCFGDNTGLIEIGATGGTSDYNFTLNGISNTTGLFQNLPAGTYEVFINDANNCESLETITLTEPHELNLELQNILPAGCDGAATGSFQVLANGGTGNNYTYTSNNQTTTNGLFENISAGVYDCIVTDENNCSTFLQITVNENSSIALDDLETINIDCFGNTSGSVNIASSGGTGVLTYTLDSINNTTGVFNNLSAGSYNIIVSDEANCSSIFPIEIIEPNAVTAMADSINNVNCFGESTGAVLLNAMGGTGNYGYFLNENPSNDGWFDNLPSGTYTAMIVDSNNCSTSFEIEISEQSELIIALDNLTNDLGNGEGSATFSVSGGTPDYTYSLDGINFQNENIFENLVSGNYTGYVQDANGCVTTIPFIIEIETAISNLEIGIQEIRVLPNPFSEKIIIQFDLISPQNLLIEIRSMDGKSILQNKSTLDSGQQNINIDVESNVPPGVYILSIQNEERMIGHFKIIKTY